MAVSCEQIFLLLPALSSPLFRKTFLLADSSHHQGDVLVLKNYEVVSQVHPDSKRDRWQLLIGGKQAQSELEPLTQNTWLAKGERHLPHLKIGE